ncbi:MAG: bifunctional 4-hydroxy-2-oxoglutarate aldolase/2-dehydro-3-deoxy-phosphogluconate aldolase [Candidatus Thalassarchaeaceae archaeon]|nr:bifunctional 4-hydroxy-2-oxoglutarate aldolase/2-dehydro-3-deoxy-phosphogluconate aldolase [Candidatus Thalassarchaeaceae archaeon]
MNSSSGEELLEEAEIQSRLKKLKGAGIIAILRGINPERMYERGLALAEMGCQAIEVTLDSPQALDIVKALRRDLDPNEVMIGVGTMLDVTMADQCAAAGAEFALSPIHPPGMVAFCHMHGILAIPGAHSMEEVVKSNEAGARIVKLFPSSSWEVSTLQQAPENIRQLPWIPVGGIDRKSCWSWMDSGAWCVGMGSNLCGSDLAIDPQKQPVESERGLLIWRQREGPRARGMFMELQRRREVT